MRKLAVVAVIAVFSQFGAGCLSSAPGRSTGQPGDQNALLVLLISNQSYATDPVDIWVYVDGELVVDELFYVRHQHHWVRFDLSLPQGTHTLYAETTTGDATIQEEILVEDTRWGVLNFWHYPEPHSSPTPPTFTFDLYNDAPSFQ